jgi:hypothetical protein
MKQQREGRRGMNLGWTQWATTGERRGRAKRLWPAGRMKRAAVAYKRKRKFAFSFRKPHEEAIYQKIDWIWNRFNSGFSCLQERRERI